MKRFSHRCIYQSRDASLAEENDRLVSPHAETREPGLIPESSIQSPGRSRPACRRGWRLNPTPAHSGSSPVQATGCASFRIASGITHGFEAGAWRSQCRDEGYRWFPAELAMLEADAASPEGPALGLVSMISRVEEA